MTYKQHCGFRIKGTQAPVVRTRPFKVIIFDVDNTLVYRLPRPARALLAFAQELGLPTHSDALQRGERRNYAYYANGQADEERALFGMAHFRRNYVAALLQAMCRTDDFSPWLDDAVTCLTKTQRTEQCPRQVRKVVRLLYQAGYHLVAVSNRDGGLQPVLTRYGLNPYFTFTLTGGWASVYKPNPEIFRITLDSLGVAPAATLTIGDSYEADIVSAQQIGITGVLLDPLGVYPEAQCRTIKRLDELIPWLVQPHANRGG